MRYKRSYFSRLPPLQLEYLEFRMKLTAKLEAIVDIAFSPIPLLQLGTHGPALPPTGLDLSCIAGVHGYQLSHQEQNAILSRALEIGNTFWFSSGLVALVPC